MDNPQAGESQDADLEGDALEVDYAALVAAPRQVIANLPYNVASPLLVGWLRQAAVFERLTLMFQQEVAERICAEADTISPPNQRKRSTACVCNSYSK